MGTVHQFYPVRNKFGSDRLFNIAGDGWYVEIREGTSGPFLNRVDAEKHLMSLKRNASERRTRLWKEG